MFNRVQSFQKRIFVIELISIKTDLKMLNGKVKQRIFGLFRQYSKVLVIMLINP